MGILDFLGGGKKSNNGSGENKTDFSDLYKQPPQTSRFSNSRRTVVDSKISSSGGLANKESKLDAKTSKEKDYLFSCNPSIEKSRAIKYIGGKVRENEKLAKRLQLHTGDGLKKFVMSATGSGEYFRLDVAKRDKKFIEEGKIEKTSFYQKATPNQQKVMRQDRDTQRGLGNIYQGMFKK